MALGSRGYPMKQVFSFPMNRRPHRQKLTPLVLFTAAALIGATHYARAQAAKVPELTVLPQSYGPYSGHILQGGIGLTKPLPAADPIVKASAPWTMSAWVEFSPAPTAPTLIAGVGDPRNEDSRFFAIVDGKPELRFGRNHSLRAADTLNPSGWHLLAASFDGSECPPLCRWSGGCARSPPGWPDPVANDDGTRRIPLPRRFLRTLRWTHRTFFAKSRSTVRASHHIPCRAETGLPSDCV